MDEFTKVGKKCQVCGNHFYDGEEPGYPRCCENCGANKKRVPYTYEECERMTALYEEDYADPVHVIAQVINEEFHEGKPVRARHSIYYGMSIYNDGKIEEDLSKWD